MVYTFFDKKASGSGMSNKELAEELYKSVFENLKKEKYTHLL